MAVTPTPRPTPADALNPAAVALSSWPADLPLAVAYSGGADSNALLLACAERWPGQTSAIHIHHGLQAAADGFARHCESVCAALGVPLQLVQVDARHAPADSASAQLAAAQSEVGRLTKERDELKEAGGKIGDEKLANLTERIESEYPAFGNDMPQYKAMRSWRIKRWVGDIFGEKLYGLVDELGVVCVDPGDVFGIEFDVWSPCALGGVVHDVSIAQLRMRGIAGSANNVLASPEHGRQLFERGVLYAPDFVINAGALLHGALFHLEGRSPPPSRIEHIGDVVGEILDRARAEARPPELVATKLALERLGAVMHRPYMPRCRARAAAGGTP